MRSLVLWGLVLVGFSSKAQITDTAVLRTFINTRIIPNGNRLITAQNLNDILNGYLNTWPNDSVSVSHGPQYDTIFYLRRGRVTNYVLVGGNRGWALSGNSGLNASTNFIGTADNTAFSIRVNNQPAGSISPTFSTTLFGYQALFASTGLGNSAFGYKTMTANTTGQANTAMGSSSLIANTTGNNNASFGFDALFRNASGIGNTALGSGAMLVNTSGSFNTSVGWNSMAGGSGNCNTVIGEQVLSHLSAADSNCVIGATAGNNLSTGSNNTFIGTNTAGGVTNGGYNTIVGANVSGLPAYLSRYIVLADGTGTRRMNIDGAGNVMFNTTTPTAHNTFMGTGAFTDTLTATTMDDSDSSNRIASTAWVKRHLGSVFAWGSYTPTYTTTSGNMGGVLFTPFRYQRTGNIVFLSGLAIITTTDGGAAILSMSLPVSSAFSSPVDCYGIAISATNPANTGAITTDLSSGGARITFNATNTTTEYLYFNLTYIIR